jgi:hypothetical protein
MRRLFFILAAACLGLVPAAGQAWAAMYDCVRPDGTVVCTVTTDQEPSVVCNHDCPDCNLVCAAQLRIVRENDTTTVVPSQPVPGRRYTPPPPGTVETKEYCQAQYDSCQAACEKNPADKSSADRKACLSSCSDTFSGCGTKPSDN